MLKKAIDGLQKFVNYFDLLHFVIFDLFSLVVFESNQATLMEIIS